MKRVKMFFSGLVAVALLGVAVAMAAEPQNEIGSGGDSASRDIDVWVPFDLGLWAAPQGSVPAGRRGSRGHTFRGSRRGGAGGGNLTGLLNSRRLREALELTDEQAEQLRKINVDTRKSTVQKRADLQVSRIELTEMLRSDDPPRAHVEQKILEITQLQGDLMQTRVAALLSARAVLTPEQQQKAQGSSVPRGEEGEEECGAVEGSPEALPGNIFAVEGADSSFADTSIGPRVLRLLRDPPHRPRRGMASSPARIPLGRGGLAGLLR